ncbi:type II toxin-antitoxin system RelE/ParE family toxin [Brevundimonas sp. TWP1-2-1b1]|uniref:type II toxin-antitoxin system RelE/ParE family toxin n=1 Tax=unclassified Brevundimonas TaxID=2622653 RepID=UPI003CECE230
MRSYAIRSLSSADRDFDIIVDHYVQEASFDTAVRFVHALDAAYVVLAAAPEAGSPIVGGALGIPDLRTWTLRGFPYLICYAPVEHEVVVWRILHTRRDLAQAFADTTFPN